MSSNSEKYKQICFLLKDFFSDSELKKEKSTQKKIKEYVKYPQTRRHKKIEHLKRLTVKVDSPRDPTFYENLVCTNKSCLILNSNKSNKIQNINLIENQLLDLQITQKFTHFPAKRIAKALTSYLIYVLKNIKPLDLLDDGEDLYLLSVFLDDLSKFIAYEIKMKKEKIDYFFTLADELKKLNNIAATESVLNGLKNSSLDRNEYQRLSHFYDNFEQEEIFLEEENAIPSLSFLLDRLRDHKDSDEFIAIIDFFSDLLETNFDEDLEYYVYCSLQEFDDINDEEEKMVSLEYLDEIEKM